MRRRRRGKRRGRRMGGGQRSGRGMVAPRWGCGFAVLPRVRRVAGGPGPTTRAGAVQPLPPPP
eukprot:3996471-Pyramimonas_sp.AAC.1